MLKTYFKATLFLCVTLNSAQSELTGPMFKNITKQFKDPMDSPLIGRVALDRGLMYNMRFFGNIDFKHNANGSREYVNDQGKDALIHFLITLFPSPTGALATQTEGDRNFGKKASPQSVAVLMNYVKALRYQLQDPHVTEAIKSLPLVKDLKNEIVNLRQEIRDIKNELTVHSYSADEISEFIQKIQELESQRHTSINSSSIISQIKELKRKIKATSLRADNEASNERIRNLENAVLNKQLSLTAIEQTLSSHFNAFKYAKLDLANSFQSANSQTKSKTKEALASEILLKLNDAVLEESNPDSLYAPHTTEQIIMAFFCLCFNFTEDVAKYTQALGADALNPDAPALNGEEKWTETSLESARTSYEQDPDKSVSHIDLDLVYITNFINFRAPIPYNTGSQTGNGNCPQFDRSQEDSTNKKAGIINHTFADCTEMAIRIFTNMMLYDFSRQRFHIPEELIQTEATNPYFRNLQQFYDIQSPANASDGSNDMRGLWNKVVGDLNYDYNTQKRHNKDIIYNAENNYEYNIKTSITNFINIWKKLLRNSLMLDPLPTATDQIQEWVEESVTKIIHVLNPAHQVISCNAIISGKTDHLNGNILITIKNKENAEFKFNLSLAMGHGKISDIMFVNNTFQSIGFNEASPTPNHTIEALIKQSNRLPRYYDYIGQRILDSNNAKISLILNTPKSLEYKDYHSYYKKVIESIDVDDAETQKRYLLAIEHLRHQIILDDENITQDILQNLLAIDDLYMRNLDKLQGMHFSRLKHLKIHKTNLQTIMNVNNGNTPVLPHLPDTQQTFDLQTFTQLKSFHITFEPQNKTVVNFLLPVSLEELKIKGNSNIQWDLFNQIHLKKLELNHCNDAILSIPDSLEEFRFSDPKSIEHINIEGMPSLKILSAPTSWRCEHFVAPSSLVGFTVDSNFKLLDLSKALNFSEIILSGDIEKFILPPKIESLNIMSGQIPSMLDLSQYQISLLNIATKHAMDLVITPPDLADLHISTSINTLDCSLSRQLKNVFIYGDVNNLNLPNTLQKLIFNSSTKTTLDLSEFNELATLHVNNNANLSYLKTPSILREFSCEGSITTLDASLSTFLNSAKIKNVTTFIAPASLDTLEIEGECGEIILDQATQFKNLKFPSHKEISIAKITLHENIKEVTISGLSKNINLSEFGNVEVLTLIDVSKLPENLPQSIHTLHLFGRSFYGLDLSTAMFIKTMFIESTANTFNLKLPLHLEELTILSQQRGTIDISACKSLRYLNVINKDLLLSLTLPSELTNIYINGQPISQDLLVLLKRK